MLANASRTWDDKKSQDAADKITSSVNQKGHSGRITCLNKIIGFNEDGSGPLSNSNGNPDFGTPFLVRLGNNLEKLDQKAIDDAVEFEKNKIRNNADAKATLIHDGSSNTLGGLIEAMTDNPEAAAQWLAPNGLNSSEQDIKRIRKITSHRALADTAWTDSVLEMTKEISTLGESTHQLRAKLRLNAPAKQHWQYLASSIRSANRMQTSAALLVWIWIKS